MPSREIQLPIAAMQFTAAVRFDAAVPGAARRFSGVAYGGGVITDHPYWDAVAFDLASLKAAAPMPLLLSHDTSTVIGVIDSVTNTGAALEISGKLFSDIEPAAASVAAKADAGMPWQLSGGLWPDRIEEVQAGGTVNGRKVERATKVMYGARMRETSFVALGADSTTHATVFGGGARTINVAFGGASSITTGDASMADTNTPADQVATLTAERDAFKAQLAETKAALDALQASFSASKKAQREAAVKELLGDKFSAESAVPYVEMTDAQFAAVAKALGEFKTSRLPEGFTSEQATGGAAGESVLVASAKSMFGVK